MKLSDIFSVNTSNSGGKKLFKKIINKYNLGTEYKKLSEGIKDSNNVVGGDVGGFRYESTKVCYRVCGTKDFSIKSVLQAISVLPYYSCIHEISEGSGSTTYEKFYLFTTTSPFLNVANANNSYNYILLEECKFEFTFNIGDEESYTVYNLMDMLKVIFFNMSEQEILTMCGIERISYEDYMNLELSQETGKELIN